MEYTYKHTEKKLFTFFGYDVEWFELFEMLELGWAEPLSTADK